MDNHSPTVTVAVLIYNPIWEKLRNTLKSIVWQKKIDFEIVIADDGSETDYFDKIEQYFKDNKFTSFKLIKNPINQGIIKNVLSAINVAEGKYIKLISPGDFLYDDNTLAQFIIFAEKNPAAAYFSNLFYYNQDSNGKITVYNDKKNPHDLRPWLKDDVSKIKKNYFIYGDYICGASVLYNKDKLLKYLSEISKFADWAEDMVIIVLLAKNEKVYYMNIPVGIWYEYGTGISTNLNSDWIKRIKLDNCNILLYLVNEGLLPKWIYKANSSSYRFKRFFIIFLHNLYYPIHKFRFRHKVFGYKNVNYDIHKLQVILDY